MKNIIPLEISCETAIKLILNKELKFLRSAKKAPGDIEISSGSGTCISFTNFDDSFDAGSLGSLDFGHYNAVSSNLSKLLNGSRIQKLASTCGWKVSSYEENAIKAEFKLNQLVSNFM